jgi:hypothetical protein
MYSLSWKSQTIKKAPTHTSKYIYNSLESAKEDAGKALLIFLIFIFRISKYLFTGIYKWYYGESTKKKRSGVQIKRPLKFSKWDKLPAGPEWDLIRVYLASSKGEQATKMPRVGRDLDTSSKRHLIYLTVPYRGNYDEVGVCDCDDNHDNILDDCDDDSDFKDEEYDSDSSEDCDDYICDDSTPVQTPFSGMRNDPILPTNTPSKTRISGEKRISGVLRA